MAVVIEMNIARNEANSMLANHFNDPNYPRIFEMKCVLEFYNKNISAAIEMQFKE